MNSQKRESLGKSSRRNKSSFLLKNIEGAGEKIGFVAVVIQEVTVTLAHGPRLLQRIRGAFYGHGTRGLWHDIHRGKRK